MGIDIGFLIMALMKHCKYLFLIKGSSYPRINLTTALGINSLKEKKIIKFYNYTRVTREKLH